MYHFQTKLLKLNSRTLWQLGAAGSVRDGRGGGNTQETSEPERSAGNHRGEH